MSFDTKCYDLAVVFLADHPRLDNEGTRKYLAQRIQDAIEEWILQLGYEDLVGEE